MNKKNGHVILMQWKKPYQKNYFPAKNFFLFIFKIFKTFGMQNGGMVMFSLRSFKKVKF